MRIALVVPTAPGCLESIHPPLGLIALRSALRSRTSAEIAILDGVDAGPENAEALAAEFQLVGLQIHALNATPATELGRALRGCGCAVAIGGPEVTISTDLTWAEGAYDVAVRGHASNDAADAILAAWTANARDPRVVTGARELGGVIDYSGLDLEPYWERAARCGRTVRHAPVVTHLGCTFRDRTGGGCSFCASVGDRASARDPGTLNQEVEQLRTLYGVSVFHCVGENVASGLARRLVRTLDAGRGTAWSFFMRASEVTPDLVPELARFGVREVRLGAESGDPALLASTAKGESIESIERALDLLDAVGIASTVSFVLGLPGESATSLRHTVLLAERWMSDFRYVHVAASVVLPIAGSRLAALAGITPGAGVTLEDQRRFVARFTRSTWDEVEAAAARITALPRVEDPAVTRIDSPWRPSSLRERAVAVARCA
jgi:hypothetical protein